MPKLNPVLAVDAAGCTLPELKAANAGREGGVEELFEETPKEKGAAADVGFGFSEPAPKLPKEGRALEESVPLTASENVEEGVVLSGPCTSLLGASSPLYFSVISTRCLS